METPWKPLETWGFQQETPWKPLETWGCQIGNPVETTGNLGLPDRKQHGNHWKPGVAKKETTGKLGVNLMESTGFHLRKPYVNYLPTMAATLNVYKYCMEMTIFWKAKLDILSLSLVHLIDRTAHIFCYIVKYRYVKPQE